MPMDEHDYNYAVCCFNEPFGCPVCKSLLGCVSLYLIQNQQGFKATKACCCNIYCHRDCCRHTSWCWLEQWLHRKMRCIECFKYKLSHALLWLDTSSLADDNYLLRND